MGWLFPWRRPVPADPAALLTAVYQGDREATERLLARLVPVIQRRVAFVLSRRRVAQRHEVLDHTQEVLARLCEQNYRILKTWDPAKGAALETFVGFAAERLVLSALRSGKKSAWREDPTLSEDLERKVDEVDLEREVWNRELLERIMDRLEEELNPRGRQLFAALFVEEQDPERVAAQLGMSLNALYSWRSRFRARVAELAAELGHE